MPNPFSYGGIVRSDDFCNRRKEILDLVRAGQNGEKLFIHGERRIGKTSLLRAVQKKLDEENVITVMINVWNCVDASDFVDLCASEFAGAGSDGNIFNRVKNIFEGLIPAVTVGDDGKPAVTLTRTSRKLLPGQLENVLKASWKIADANRDQRLVVIFDEFQQIRNLGSESIERILRSIVQERSDIAWFFCGSRTHLIREMFLNPAYPLYRSAGHYPLGKIDEKHWIPFIASKLRAAERQVSENILRKLVAATSGHPFYTQMLSSALWDISEPGIEITGKLVDDAIEVLLEREHSTYLILWDSLPEMSRRMLRAVASEDPLKKPYSEEVLSKYGFKSPSSASRAIQHLVTGDVITGTTESGYRLIDRFLRMWCSRNLLKIR